MQWFNNPSMKFKIVLVAILLAAFFFALRYFGETQQPVTMTSQQQAETPRGVQQAAENAKVKILESQLIEAAEQIAYLKNKPPDTVVRTIVKEVPVAIEQERVKSKADFALVTDPSHPDKTVNLDGLPDNTPVTLKQYNVHAYKKIIRGIDIYPDIDRLRYGKFGVDEVSFDWNKKISNDGKYIGLKTGYEFDDKEVKLGIRMMF